MKTELNREQMLSALSIFSNNELIQERAKEALKGNIIESGGFFNAVLLGDYGLAYRLADNDNKKAFRSALALHNQHNF